MGCPEGRENDAFGGPRLYKFKHAHSGVFVFSDGNVFLGLRSESSDGRLSVRDKQLRLILWWWLALDTLTPTTGS